MKIGERVTVSEENKDFKGYEGRVVDIIDNNVTLYIFDLEEIKEIPCSDIIEPEAELFVPRSRKEFYQYVHRDTTSRIDIINTIQEMEGLGHINISFRGIEKFIKDHVHGKHEIVQYIREQRNMGKIEFLLPNR